MHTGNPYSVLIVDSSWSATGSATGSATETPASSRIHHAATAAEAKRALGDESLNFAGILINPLLRGAGALSVISLAHERRPATPIYLLQDERPAFAETQLHRMALAGSLLRSARNPIKAEEACALFDSGIFAAKAPNRRRSPKDIDPAYLPVPAQDFLSGIATPFDVFVRLPSGKFLKIVESKDVFPPRRAQSYIEKGVTHFYLKRESHARCYSYCNVLAQHLLTQRCFSPELKATETLSRGQTVLDLIQRQGLDPAHLDFAGEFLQDVHALVGQLDLRDKSHESMLRRMVADFPGYDNAVAATMIAGLIALPLGIVSSATFGSLGLASLLQDIGLYAMPEKLRSLEPSAMTPEQREVYETHPNVGAEQLNRIPGVENVVVQAVAQHHERRDGQGFPRRASSSEINRIAEVVGISAYFTRLIPEIGRDPSFDFMSWMEASAFDGYSFPVIEAFREVFGPVRS